ncbi:MAG: 50S ribosomal protein L17 [Deltaproteobacteria bacterium]|jgi:large subunit ribosomal protein L17|nr:50S ribosomal protein L17 [Deltaproteobacteria bacterium]
MRHRKANVKLGRTASHRNAMLRNMATSLFEVETIRTTVAKAKALKPVVDRMITLAKRGDLSSRRLVAACLTRPSVVRALFKTAAVKFAGRGSGYCLMARIGHRYGDNAPMCVLSLATADAAGARLAPRTGSKSSDRGRRVAASRASESDSRAARVAASKAAEPEAAETGAAAEPEAAEPEAAETETAETDVERAPEGGEDSGDKS